MNKTKEMDKWVYKEWKVYVVEIKLEMDETKS